jgi:hypothetical protein
MLEKDGLSQSMVAKYFFLFLMVAAAFFRTKIFTNLSPYGLYHQTSTSMLTTSSHQPDSIGS